MKQALLGAVVALITALPAAASDAVWGIWQTEVDDGSYAHIEMKGCSGGLSCGWMLRSFYEGGAAYQSENLGKILVKNMENTGNGKYRGTVWRPSNDKDYIGKMELNGNSLILKGCVAGGLFCSSQTWTRVE